MKKLLYVLLILIICGLSYLKWQAWNSPAPQTSLPSPSPTQSVITSNTQVLTTPYFSLEYPSVATTSPISESPDSTSWSLRFMGEQQVKSGRTQTELFDGYATTITVFPSVVGDDPQVTQAESDRQGTINGCGESSVTKLKTVQVAGENATSFSGGCLGEANHFYFMHKNMLFRITTMAVGTPEDVFSYQQTIDKMLASLKLLQ